MMKMMPDAGTLPPVTLTVKIQSDALQAGSVTSSPEGIECQDHCEYTFPAGTLVTLTAWPPQGSSFFKWKGSSCTSNASDHNTCTLTLDQDQTVVAQFSQNPEAYPAPHPDLPEVKYQGGRIMENPIIKPITFTVDKLAPEIEKFITQFVSSAYFSAVTNEYTVPQKSIGSATMGVPIHINEDPPLVFADSQIQDYLIKQLDGPNPPWGKSSQDTIYILYYPESTIAVGTGDGSSGCDSYDSWYWNLTLPQNQQSITYVVIPRCQGSKGLTTLNKLTVSSSRELIEAVTNPQPRNMPAFNGLDKNHRAWQILLGSRVGSLCRYVEQLHVLSFTFQPQDMDYLVQPIWSNLAAKKGSDPCIPEANDGSYFNSAAVFNDQITYTDGNNNTVSTIGVNIAPPDYVTKTNYSKTIDVQLYSDGPTEGAWNLSASDLTDTNDFLDFHFDKTKGVNGDTVHLTITLNQTNSILDAEPFYIQSELNGVKHYWYGLVGNGK